MLTQLFRKLIALFFASAALWHLAGCVKTLETITWPTIADVKEMARHEREGLDAQSDMISRQHEAMTPEAADAISEIKNAFDARLTKIGAKADAMEGTLVAALADLAGVQRSQSTAATTLTEVSTAISDQRLTNATTARDVVELVADVSAATTELDTMSDALRTSIDELAGTVGTRLQELTDNTRDDILRLRDTLIAEAKLTPDEIEKLKGMAPAEQLIALLSILGVGGVASVAGRLGPSRSKETIAEIKAEVKEIAKAKA